MSYTYWQTRYCDLAFDRSCREVVETGEEEMKKSACSLVSVSLLATGCATSSADIASAYVSPLQYQSYDCDQLTLESVRIQRRVAQLGGRLDEAASNDKAITGVGIILFWPALFALGGTKQQEAEYARLKGEYEALEQAAIQKKCATRTAAAAPGSTGASAPTISSQPADAPSGNSLSATQTAPNVTLPSLQDKTLSVGGKTVVLGGSQWFLLGESKSSLTGSIEPWSSSGAASVVNLREVKTSTRTAVEITGQSLGRVVAVTANATGSGGLSSWNVEPCKISDTRLRDTFGGNFGSPECLYVRDVSSALAPEGNPLANAVRWASASGISRPPEYSETVYAKYGGGGFLHITVFAPRNVADQGVGAVLWARSLSDSMRPLAEGKRSSGYLPE